jgi:hypothetical protein
VLEHRRTDDDMPPMAVPVDLWFPPEAGAIESV